MPIAASLADFQKEQDQFEMLPNDKAVASKAKKEDPPKAVPVSQQPPKPATKAKVADSTVQAQQMNHPGT